MALCRNIVEEGRFKEERDALGLDPKRLDELLEDITWALSHDPLLGKKTTVPGILAITIDPWATFTHALAIYYKFDDNTIWFLSIVQQPGVCLE